MNYAIPGFILYRMVYSFSYTLGTETFNLKSEIMDISIPSREKTTVNGVKDIVAGFVREAQPPVDSEQKITYS